jgi:hypothetical protein
MAWLVPGYGLWAEGLHKRAIGLFLVLQGTFLVGCMLRGSVQLPDMQGGSDGFNIVAILVFLVQLGNGGLALLSLLPEVLGPGLAVLPTNEAHDYADLGQMWLLVSGGMNYFLVMASLSSQLGTDETGQRDCRQAPEEGTQS